MSMYEILSELRRKEEAKAWTEIDFPISLKEALERLTKVELDEIRKTYDFKGISSLNKADLIDKLVDLIPKYISRTLKWLDEERYSLIEKIIHNKGLLKVDGFDIKKIRFYKRSALVFTGSLDGKKVLFIPGEIIDAIKEAMDNKTRSMIKDHGLWIKLAEGLIYYYGYVKTGVLYEMLKGYLNEDIDLFEFIITMINGAEYYDKISYYKGGFYYSFIGIEDIDFIIDDIEARPDIDYYKFTKAQVLDAASDKFVENSLQVLAFKKYMKSNFKLSDREINELLRGIYLMANYDVNPGEVVMNITEFYPLESEKQLYEIVPLVMNLLNNTRRWILKGHSPNMIRQSNQENLQPLQDDKNNNNLYSIKTKEKIGRNDPCPCGSGLKYKKCCGR